MPPSSPAGIAAGSGSCPGSSGSGDAVQAGSRTSGLIAGGTVRTVCVRLCDGYYFPISFSTTRGRLGKDEQACRSRCSGDARLFYYRTSGGSPETMVDRRGNAYADLKGQDLESGLLSTQEADGYTLPTPQV